MRDDLERSSLTFDLSLRSRDDPSGSCCMSVDASGQHNESLFTSVASFVCVLSTTEKELLVTSGVYR